MEMLNYLKVASCGTEADRNDKHSSQTSQKLYMWEVEGIFSAQSLGSFSLPQCNKSILNISVLNVHLAVRCRFSGLRHITAEMCSSSRRSRTPSSGASYVSYSILVCIHMFEHLRLCVLASIRPQTTTLLR